MNIGFIGTGKIASSVIQGIFKSKISFRKIYISERNKKNSQKLKKKYTGIKKGSLYQKRNGKNKIDNIIGYKN